MPQKKEQETLRRSRRAAMLTDPERQYGGPQSGLPLDFEVGSELAPYLIVGIDFGTNYCRLMTFDDGAPRAVQPQYFRALVEDVLKVDVEQQNLVHSLKHCLSENYVVKQYNEVFSAVDIGGMFLRDVKASIEKSHDKQLAKAVLSVPACYTHRQRASMIRAATEADIAVLGLINDTTAALLDICFAEDLRNGHFLVISSGTYSFEASLFHVQNRLIETKSTKGSRFLSGHNVTHILTQELAKQLDIESGGHLHIAIDRAKVELDKVGTAQIEFGEKTFKVTRAIADECLKEYKSVASELIDSLLKESQIAWSDVTAVVFTGAATKLNLLRHIVNSRITAPKYEGNITAGAAIYAALLVRQAKDWVVWDSLATPVLIAQGDHIKEVIAANSPLPINGHITLASGADGKAVATVLQRSNDTNETVMQVANVRVAEELRSEDAKDDVDLAVMATADGTLTFTTRHKMLDVNLTVEVGLPEHQEPTLIDLTPWHVDHSIPEDTFDAGFSIVRIGQKWFVRSVAVDSPAEEAGVRVFDELTVIGFSQVKDLDNVVQPHLTGKKDTFVELGLRRANANYAVLLNLTVPLYKSSAEGLKLAIADAQVDGNDRRLVECLLDYAEFWINQSAASNLDEGEKSINRALKMANESLDPHDPLLVRALSLSCSVQIQRAIADEEREERRQSIQDTYERLDKILTQSRSLPAESISHIWDVVCQLVRFVRLAEVAQSDAQIHTLTKHAFAIGLRHNVDRLIWQHFTRRIERTNARAMKVLLQIYGAQQAMEVMDGLRRCEALQYAIEDDDEPIADAMVFAAGADAAADFLSTLSANNEAVNWAFNIAVAYKEHGDWWLEQEAAGDRALSDELLHNYIESECRARGIRPCLSSRGAYELAKPVLGLLIDEASKRGDINRQTQYSSVLAAVLAGLDLDEDAEVALNSVFRLIRTGATCEHNTVQNICDVYFTKKRYLSVQNLCLEQARRLSVHDSNEFAQLEIILRNLARASAIADDAGLCIVAHRRLIELCGEEKEKRFKLSVQLVEMLLRCEDRLASEYLLEVKDLGLESGMLSEAEVQSWTAMMEKLRGQPF